MTAELFGVGTLAICKHWNNIFEEDELKEISTASKIEIFQIKGSCKIKRLTEFYNLDSIISVGERVNSIRATQFRQ